MKGLTGRVARRGSIVATAYLSTSAVTLAVLFAFARHGDATLLRSMLGAQFVASLAAGLEPATAKALALRAPGFDAPAAATVRGILVASSLKALVASPVLAFVWRLSDPGAGWPLLLCVPLVCIAGFGATDLRVVFDLQGRHAEAIWIKQGSLGGGLIILAIMAASGAPMPLALAVASLARIATTLLVAVSATASRGPVSGVSLRDMLRDPRWMSLAGASVVAAVGGSADRVFGLRYLSADDWAGYYALYEVFSKFWFIPYVVAPIVFARAAAGLDSARVGRLAWRMTTVAGMTFVIGVGATLLAAPGLPLRPAGGAARVRDPVTRHPCLRRRRRHRQPGADPHRRTAGPWGSPPEPRGHGGQRPGDDGAVLRRREIVGRSWAALRLAGQVAGRSWADLCAAFSLAPGLARMKRMGARAGR